jgi:hypothetical protein
MLLYLMNFLEYGVYNTTRVRMSHNCIVDLILHLINWSQVNINTKMKSSCISIPLRCPHSLAHLLTYNNPKGFSERDIRENNWKNLEINLNRAYEKHLEITASISNRHKLIIFDT